MSLTISTILAATEAAGEHVAEEHKSETPFFIAGGALAAFAILISVFGMRSPSFPGSAGASRGVMTLGLALTVAAMVSIVYVSG